MDRNEAVLRELNLYPLWRRRNQSAVAKAGHAASPVPLVLSVVCPEPGLRVEGSARTVKDDIHACPPVVVPTPQTDKPGWREFKQQVRNCTACKLRTACTRTVFGTGDEQAEWLFVGEGPGADEDERGEPFVGQSGKLLDNMLLAINLRRGENVYIANIVKCRPPDDRTPDADEIASCLHYLQRQIELVKPRLIVALGRTASTALLGKNAQLSALRGRLHDYCGIPLVATFHPAYLLRCPMEKANAWQDLCLAVDTMRKLSLNP